MKMIRFFLLVVAFCSVALMISCAATGTVVVGNEGDVHFSSDLLKACPGATFELTITQQDAQGNSLPPVTVRGTAAAGSIQFNAKDINFGKPVKLSLKLISGSCEIDPDEVTDWIALNPVPNKKDVYTVDLSKFHKKP